MKKFLNVFSDSKYSIRRQFALIFCGVLAGSILLCILINTFFINVYYLRTYQKNVAKAYNTINVLINDNIDDLDSDEFNKAFYQLCDTYNINVVIIDSSLQLVKASSPESSANIKRLISYLFKDDPNFAFERQDVDELDNIPDGRSGINSVKPADRIYKVVEDNNKYSVHISSDPKMDLDYIELSGTLDNGNIILIRSAIQSIRKNAELSNRFLIMVGLPALLAGMFIVWGVSKYITNPILELADISEKMANLDFDTKYNRKDKNEIGILGNHINELSFALENTISELKKANNELKDDIAHKEKIDLMRKEFLSNVSHELKTPIALIQGYAEGLKDGISDDPESAEFYCNVIIDEANKMNKLVKNLITLNQYEFGIDNVDVERFDIVALIKNYIRNIEIFIDSVGGQIIFEYDDPIYVWADEFKTEEVVQNYFSNAINHLDGDKKIIVDLMQKENTLRVSIFNSGNNIPDEALGNIWDKFYKVDKARSREYGGSGIGLSIVKAIMEAQHQDYGVINKDDGVEFYFELDCKQE